jgi:hypothetical protein
VRRVAQGDDADGPGRRELLRPVDRAQRVGDAGAEIAVVDLHRADALHQRRLGVEVDPAAAEVVDETGHPVEAVRRDAIAAGLGVHAGAGARVGLVHAGLAEGVEDDVVHVLEGDAGHGNRSWSGLSLRSGLVTSSKRASFGRATGDRRARGVAGGQRLVDAPWPGTSPDASSVVERQAWGNTSSAGR